MYAQDDLTNLLEAAKIEGRKLAKLANKPMGIDTAENCVFDMLLKGYIDYLYFKQP